MKNFEELKEAIKGNSFNESHLSNTQVVDLETVIGLIEDFEQLTIPDVVGQSEQLKCDHQPKKYNKKHTSCKKCGKILQMKP